MASEYGYNKLIKLNLLQSNMTTVAAPGRLVEAMEQFPAKMTEAIRSLMTNAQDDEIVKQFVPSWDEMVKLEGENKDPIGDEAHSPVKGIVHRYPDRCLLLLTNICAVHCRYCFRRAKIGKAGQELKRQDIEKAVDYIRQHHEIWEVILSGGDPLILSDRKLMDVLVMLRSIEHVKVLRIHTRMPIVQPKRVTENLVAALRAETQKTPNEKPLYMILHCNNARELTGEVREACALLVNSGIPLLSQSVLLKGVNDTAEALRDLMKACVESRIKPYYLHHCDLAEGISHFRTTIAQGQALLKDMRGMVSGLCQPTYILDIPGGKGKVPVDPSFLEKDNDEYLFTDYLGCKHRYHDVL